MTHYEYKVIPAPAKAEKAKGIKTPEGRFAQTIETAINRLAEGGWEFQRAELLPSEERQGLTGSTTTWRNLLVFRRPVRAMDIADPPEAMDEAVPAPVVDASDPEVAPVPAPSVLDDDEEPSPVVAIDELRAARAQADVTPDTPPLTTRPEDEPDERR